MTVPWLTSLPTSTSVDLRFPVRPADHRTALGALGGDALHAEVRQVWYLESEGFALMRHGVTVRATRRAQGTADVVVGVRLEGERDLVALFDVAQCDATQCPVVSGVEVDVGHRDEMPWCLFGTDVTEARLRALLSGRLVLQEVLSGQQSKVLVACVGKGVAGGVSSGVLEVLPPVQVLARSYLPRGYSRRLSAESWFPPDGARRLVLVARCRPSSAPEVASVTRRFLTARGIHLGTDRTTAPAAVPAASSP